MDLRTKIGENIYAWNNVRSSHTILYAIFSKEIKNITFFIWFGLKIHS